MPHSPSPSHLSPAFVAGLQAGRRRGSRGHSLASTRRRHRPHPAPASQGEVHDGGIAVIRSMSSGIDTVPWTWYCISRTVPWYCICPYLSCHFTVKLSYRYIVLPVRLRRRRCFYRCRRCCRCCCCRCCRHLLQDGQMVRSADAHDAEHAHEHAPHTTCSAGARVVHQSLAYFVRPEDRYPRSSRLMSLLSVLSAACSSLRRRPEPLLACLRGRPARSLGALFARPGRSCSLLQLRSRIGGLLSDLCCSLASCLDGCLPATSSSSAAAAVASSTSIDAVHDGRPVGPLRP